jgi:hypothetical protein
MRKTLLTLLTAAAVVGAAALAPPACDRDSNHALKYKTVDASKYAAPCRAFMTDCLGAAASDADSACAWIDDANEVPACARDAIERLLACFDQQVDCSAVDEAAQQAVSDCEDAFDAEVAACYDSDPT